LGRFFNSFVGKDYKDFLSNPILVPVEDTELFTNLKNKIKRDFITFLYNGLWS